MRSVEAYGGQPIGIRARSGDLWFATLDGLALCLQKRYGFEAEPLGAQFASSKSISLVMFNSLLENQSLVHQSLAHRNH